MKNIFSKFSKVVASFLSVSILVSGLSSVFAGPSVSILTAETLSSRGIAAKSERETGIFRRDETGRVICRDGKLQIALKSAKGKEIWTTQRNFSEASTFGDAMVGWIEPLPFACPEGIKYYQFDPLCLKCLGDKSPSTVKSIGTDGVSRDVINIFRLRSGGRRVEFPGKSCLNNKIEVVEEGKRYQFNTVIKSKTKGVIPVTVRVIRLSDLDWRIEMSQTLDGKEEPLTWRTLDAYQYSRMMIISELIEITCVMNSQKR